MGACGQDDEAALFRCLRRLHYAAAGWYASPLPAGDEDGPLPRLRSDGNPAGPNERTTEAAGAAAFSSEPLCARWRCAGTRTELRGVATRVSIGRHRAQRRNGVVAGRASPCSGLR